MFRVRLNSSGVGYICNEGKHRETKHDRVRKTPAFENRLMSLTVLDVKLLV